MAKTYTSVPNVATGDVYTASTYNTMTAQNINNLRVPPAAVAYRNTGQTLSNATVTIVQFNQTDPIDTDTMHDTSTNNTRITCTTAGVYLVTGNVTFTPNTTLARRRICILKNNTETDWQTEAPNVSAAGTGNSALSVTAIIEAAANDYFELNAYQSSGGNLDVQKGFLAAVWMGQVS